jgi:hypothetical protein
MAMVVKANRHNPEDGGDLGGHIGSFASLAHMFGAGFNHFWHAESEGHGGDCIYIQGHVAPGVYARAYMEGRLTEEQLLNFRQEVDGKGLSSYPHPKLMPECKNGNSFVILDFKQYHVSGSGIRGTHAQEVSESLFRSQFQRQLDSRIQTPVIGLTRTRQFQCRAMID